MSSLRAAGRISSRTTFLYPFIAAMSEGVQYVRSPEWDLADRTGLLCREHLPPVYAELFHPDRPTAAVGFHRSVFHHRGARVRCPGRSRYLPALSRFSSLVQQTHEKQCLPVFFPLPPCPGHDMRRRSTTSSVDPDPRLSTSIIIIICTSIDADPRLSTICTPTV